MASDAMLTVTIENTAPIELLDLSESLQSLGRQYVRYLNKHNIKVADDARLYVQEVRKGSAVFELVDLAPLLPVIFADAENYNNIIDFAKNLREVYNYFIGKGPAPKEELKQQDLRNYKTILNPVAKDSGANMILSGDFRGANVIVLNLSSLEANAAQNAIERAYETLNTKEAIGEHDKVVFYWHTLKKQQESGDGERGVIESLSKAPVKVVFANDTIKSEMAFMTDKNPMLVGFIVDVIVETVQEKPVLYNIRKVHGVV